LSGGNNWRVLVLDKGWEGARFELQKAIFTAIIKLS